MAKMGKVKREAIEKDKEERAKQNRDFKKWMKFKKGTNFFRMLPPPEDMGLHWKKVKKHFKHKKEKNGVCNCTKTGKDCFICKKVKIAENSKDKKERKIADDQKVSTGFVSQGIDMTPLYTKEGKDWIADNPPPKCFGKPKKDEDDEFIGKCQRCSWNESCDRGIQLASFSGQRIEDISNYFDECDITDLKEGRNIMVKRKGEKRFDTSYKIKISKKFEYELPKFMINYIEENFIDLNEELKPSTPEETEAAYYGEQEADDIPECFGDFKPKKKKCKNCEYSDLCQEENEPDEDEEEDLDDNNDNDNNDNDDNDNNDNDDDNEEDSDNDNDDDEDEEEDLDDNNDNDNNDNDDDDEDEDNDNDDDEDEEDEPKKKSKKKSKKDPKAESIKKKLKNKASKKKKKK